MNDELKDFELGSPDPEPGPTEGEAPARAPRWPYLVGALVVLLLVAAFLFFRYRQPEVAEPVAEPPSSEPAPAAEPPESKLELGAVPPLADSDGWLREVARQVSAHPQLAKWLLTDELIRTFVVVVDNVAEGSSPATHLAVVKPDTGFAAREAQGRVFVDPASYRRYDLLVDVVGSLDPAGTAELYRAIQPLCQEAYGDLGYPDRQFDETLSRATERLLATPVVEGPIELRPRITAYQYQDPALEGLSPAAKQFLRLGPENLERLQAKVRELMRAMELEPED